MIKRYRNLKHFLKVDMGFSDESVKLVEEYGVVIVADTLYLWPELVKAYSEAGGGMSDYTYWLHTYESIRDKFGEEMEKADFNRIMLMRGVEEALERDKKYVTKREDRAEPDFPTVEELREKARREKYPAYEKWLERLAEHKRLSQPVTTILSNLDGDNISEDIY